MNTPKKATTSPRRGAVDSSSVVSVGVRIAGRVPTRVDLRFAGTAEQQIGLSLGSVLVYARTLLAVRAVALAWGEAAPQARSLSPMLAERRRPVVGSGPWSIAAVVRLAGMPHIESMLLPARAGSDLPTMLRIQVGPITWELCDAASFTALLQAWRTAADLLAIESGE